MRLALCAGRSRRELPPIQAPPNPHGLAAGFYRVEGDGDYFLRVLAEEVLDEVVVVGGVVEFADVFGDGFLEVAVELAAVAVLLEEVEVDFFGHHEVEEAVEDAEAAGELGDDELAK